MNVDYKVKVVSTFKAEKPIDNINKSPYSTHRYTARYRYSYKSTLFSEFINNIMTIFSHSKLIVRP